MDNKLPQLLFAEINRLSEQYEAEKELRDKLSKNIALAHRRILLMKELIEANGGSISVELDF